MNKSMNYKDVMIFVLYLSGVLGLAPGGIFVSAALIGAALIMSYFHFRKIA